MKYVMYNGLGLILNFIGLILIVAGRGDPDLFMSMFGIIIFVFGILSHFQFWAPLRHIVAAIFYLVAIMSFQWESELRGGGALFLIGAVIIHWRFWLCVWIGKQIYDWVKS